MNVKDQIPSLQAAATVLLPGLKHARSLLDVSIRVLEYFETHALKDAHSGTVTALPAPDRKLIEDVANVRRMLSAFGRLHENRH